jgi:hypothetical protein
MLSFLSLNNGKIIFKQVTKNRLGNTEKAWNINGICQSFLFSDQEASPRQPTPAPGTASHRCPNA